MDDDEKDIRSSSARLAVVEALMDGWLVAREKRILAFAKSRNLETTGEYWQMKALIAAGYEHPEIKNEKRKRGRPKKSPVNSSVDVLRAQITALAQKDYPGLSVKEWIAEIKAIVEENPKAKELFFSDERTLESSISRGKTKLRKNDD